MFVNCNLPGLAFAFPDVCLTPTPVGPIPLPYPNMSMPMMGIPSQFSTFLTCMPAHNMTTTVPMTNGDNVGVNMGVASGMVMGPERAVKGSTNLMLGCMPAKRALIDPTIHNSTNAVGTTLVPTQFKFLSFR
ncbi:Domain of unknown function DUF4150 [Rhabdaerophilaceae bacterium]